LGVTAEKRKRKRKQNKNDEAHGNSSAELFNHVLITLGNSTFKGITFLSGIS